MSNELSLRVRVWNPTKSRCKELVVVIDTGFAGGLLLPLETYLELGLNMYEEPKAIGRLATGSLVELRVSRALVEIQGKVIPCKAYTLLGRIKPLLGMEVISHLRVTYDPKKGELHVELDP